MVKIVTKLMTENDCYKAGRTIVPRGITIHSTAEPGIRAADWFDLWNKPASEQNGREVCVHAFLDDAGVMQYLPWDMRGWHAGGSDNNDHIGTFYGSYRTDNTVSLQFFLDLILSS